MPKKTADRREAPISYRPPKAQREAFYRRAERSGLSMNAFITQCVLGGPPPRQSRRPPAEKSLIARLLQQAGAIADRLHAIPPGEDGTHDPDLKAALDDLAQIRTALMSLLGRKP